MAVNRTDSDLALTVLELSEAYEELSLLYRMSEVFSFLSVEEICSKIADEARSALGVRTAAVLFTDDQNGRMITKTTRGYWPSDLQFSSDLGIIGRAIELKKSTAVCNLAETEYARHFPGMTSLMVCPLLGKVKVLGVVVVADKESEEEFYSYDFKLLSAVSAQAGLAIENAFLYSELEALLVGAIKSLVKTLEATSCWTAGHTERVTDYACGIGRVMGLDGESLERLKICSLLHDIGKIAVPKEILNKESVLTAEEWAEIRKHPVVGAGILGELKQFKDILLSIKYHHEHWDGSRGIFGLKGEEIPFIARILAVADAFDAMTSDRPYRRMLSRDEAVAEIRRCAGSQFDPEVVEAFLAWTGAASPRHQGF